MSRALDFSLLPDESSFERRSILIATAKELKVSLASMPETLLRVESAIMFAGWAGKQDEPWRTAAGLRAALSEFCSIEEMQSFDRPGQLPFRISACRQPLLHILELMRHLNVHVKTVQSRPHSINVRFHDKPFDMNVHVVSNLAAEDLIQLKNGKQYAKEELLRLVAWFNEQQMHWGAGDLITIGAKALGAAVAAHHGLLGLNVGKK